MLRDVEVAGVKDGAVQLKFKSPDHGLVVDSVVFAFDQAPYEQGGRYVGEFKVTAVAEGSPDVTVVPNLPLTEAQTQALDKAKGPWALYATMPVDDPAEFASLDEATRAKLLPKDSVADYGKADRELHDYKAFFHEDVVQRALIEDSIAKINNNIQRMAAATKECNDEIAYRQTEQTNLTADLGQFKNELKAIAAYEIKLDSLYRQLRDKLKATYVQMRDRTAELTARQFKEADEINRAAPRPPRGSGKAAAGSKFVPESAEPRRIVSGDERSAHISNAPHALPPPPDLKPEVRSLKPELSSLAFLL